MLFQLNVLTLGQLNSLRLIQLLYYGWAQPKKKGTFYDSGIQIQIFNAI